MPKYLVLADLLYNGKSVKAGTTVEDIPAESVKWLKKDGLIEDADGRSKSKQEAVKAKAKVVKAIDKAAAESDVAPAEVRAEVLETLEAEHDGDLSEVKPAEVREAVAGAIGDPEVGES